MDEGKLQLARDAFNKAIAARSDTPDCFYHRGVCALLLGDAAAAVPDLEMAVQSDPSHDFYRAVGLLAQAYAQTGAKGKSRSVFPAGSRAVDAVRNLSELSPISSRRRDATPRPASGRRRCWIKSPPCPAICAAASAPGFAAPKLC